ncbi:MAG: hypothetical protein QW156_05070 [Candidatus Aenigmatarchaeota archaeon]
MQKKFDIEQLEKLFELKIEYNTLQKFMNILNQSLQFINQEIIKIEQKKNNIKEFTGIPFEEELIFDFQELCVKWEEKSDGNQNNINQGD